MTTFLAQNLKQSCLTMPTFLSSCLTVCQYKLSSSLFSSCLPVFLCFSLFVFLCSSLPVFLSFCLHVFLSSCLSVFLSSCLLVFLSSCFPVFMSFCIIFFLYSGLVFLSLFFLLSCLHAANCRALKKISWIL